MLCLFLAIDLHLLLRYHMEIVTLAAGCFWCVEAVFQQLKGVTSVVSGYTGGNTDNPTYKEVSKGITGHAEACQIEFDPEQITFEDLLEVRISLKHHVGHYLFSPGAFIPISSTA